MEPNKVMDDETEGWVYEAEKEAAAGILARLVKRPEDRNDASMMLSPDYFWDSLQYRVYLAIIERPAAYEDYFAYELEKTLRDRGDVEAADYIGELRLASYPYSRRDFLQGILLLHDLTAPRRAYELEMRSLDEMQEEEMLEDENVQP